MATKYLNRETAAELTGARVSEFPLPYEPDVIVRVRSQSMDRMNRYSEAVQKGGELAKKQTYSLIAASIVDENDSPVWSEDAVRKLAAADCRLVSALVAMISKHNGGDGADVEEMVGNFEATQNDE